MIKEKIFNDKFINNNILVFFILFVFLEPAFFQSYKWIHNMFNMVRILTFLWITFYYIFNRVKPNRFIVAILIYYFIISASTLYNKGPIIRFILSIIPQIGFLLFIEVLLSKNILKTLGVFNVVYSILIYTNLLMIFLFPNGYNNYTNNGTLVVTHFLGNRNLFVMIIIPAILVSVLYSILKYKKINCSSIILILAGIITVVQTRSATSTIGVTLMALYLLIFFNRERLDKIITGKILSISYIIMYLGIVVFRQQERLGFLIEDILGKSVTLSTRTLIWDQVILMIKDRPIFGHGSLGNNSYVVMSNGSAFHPHNYFLHVLFTGGIILGIWIAYIFLRSMANLDKYKSNISKFIMFTIFTVLIVMIVGTHPFIPILLILSIANHIEEIEEINKFKKGNVQLL